MVVMYGLRRFSLYLLYLLQHCAMRIAHRCVNHYHMSLITALHGRCAAHLLPTYLLPISSPDISCMHTRCAATRGMQNARERNGVSPFFAFSPHLLFFFSYLYHSVYSLLHLYSLPSRRVKK